jgi:hypothetical protein
MSGKGKAAVILVLVICACSLAVHFVAEGLLPVDGPGFDLVTNGGHAHPVHEHGDDYFVLVCPNSLPLENLSAFLPYPPENGVFLLSISPLLPPPNF